jgi:hypothetical protein
MRRFYWIGSIEYKEIERMGPIRASWGCGDQSSGSIVGTKLPYRLIISPKRNRWVSTFLSLQFHGMVVGTRAECVSGYLP